MIAYETGGDNFALVSATIDRNPHPDLLELSVDWLGKYPLRDVTVRPDGTYKRFAKDLKYPPFEQPLRLGNLPPGPASIRLEPIALLYDRLHLRFDFSALNGHWSQTMDVIQVGDKWLQKITAQRGEKVLYDHTDDGYPPNADTHIDAMRRIYDGPIPVDDGRFSPRPTLIWR